MWYVNVMIIFVFILLKEISFYFETPCVILLLLFYYSKQLDDHFFF
jgi:hypothetical protein